MDLATSKLTTYINSIENINEIALKVSTEILSSDSKLIICNLENLYIIEYQNHREEDIQFCSD